MSAAVQMIECAAESKIGPRGNVISPSPADRRSGPPVGGGLQSGSPTAFDCMCSNSSVAIWLTKIARCTPSG
jgi:hypothetical protein